MPRTIEDVFEHFQENREYINKLINEIQRGRVIPFLGAGMSVFDKDEDIYPTWEKYLEKIYESNAEKVDHRKDEYENASLMEKAKILTECITRARFINKTQEIFDKKLLKDIDLNNESVGLMPNIFNQGLVITTNYDLVLENIYRDKGKSVDPIINNPKDPETFGTKLRKRKDAEENEVFIYKIHGDISNNPNDLLTISSEDYLKLYQNGKAIEELAAIYMQEKILFLGCGLATKENEKDEAMKLFQDRTKNEHFHYAIIPIEKNLDILERQKRINALMEQYKIQAIAYLMEEEKDHEYLKIILKYIAKKVNEEEDINCISREKCSKTSFDLDLTKYFNGQVLKEETSWDDVKQEIVKYSDENIETGKKYNTYFNAHLSVGFVFGYFLPEKRNVNMVPFQYMKDHRVENFSKNNDYDENKLDSWQKQNESEEYIIEGSPQKEGDIVVVMQAVKGVEATLATVKEYLKNNNDLKYSYVKLYISPKGVADGNHAEKLAEDFKSSIGAVGNKKIHIFYNGPIALAFIIGRKMEIYPNIVLYEYFNGEYYQSITIENKK